MLDSSVIALRPFESLITRQASGTVSEGSNDQFASGGDNAASVRLDVGEADLDAVALEYVDVLKQDGWSEITVDCLGPSPQPTIQLIARSWVGYETTAIVTLVERGAVIEVSVVLRAPFHDSIGSQPDATAPVELDCLAA